MCDAVMQLCTVQVAFLVRRRVPALCPALVSRIECSPAFPVILLQALTNSFSPHKLSSGRPLPRPAFGSSPNLQVRTVPQTAWCHPCLK